MSKDRPGFLFPVDDVRSFSHDEKNVNVDRRGVSCSIGVNCHARISVLPLDQAEYADQYSEYCSTMSQTREISTDTLLTEHDESTFTAQRGRTMPTAAAQILSTVARELGISEDDLLRQGLRSFLERQLREVKAELFEISGRYGVSSVTEMEARYRDGTLEEADSWRDLQRLDHLEHKRDCLLQLLEVVV
jgi:hypothetical protein